MVPMPSGTLQFTPGNRLQAINIPITDDQVAESSEDFEVMLVPVGETDVVINMASTIVTITDDDSKHLHLVSNLLCMSQW